MSEETITITMAVRQVLAKHGIDNVELEFEIANVMKPFIFAKATSVRAERGDLTSWYTVAPERMAQMKMRERVENALHKNLDFEDDDKFGWAGFDKWLVAEEAQTGRTIEQWVVWYKSDSFRANGMVYLNQRKIKENWLLAFVKEAPVTAATIRQANIFDAAARFSAGE